MKFKTLIVLGATVAALPAHAGTKPLFQPAPAWVVPAPPIDAAKSAAVPRVIFDQQQKLADGQVWSYTDTANLVTSQESLLQAGTVILSWQPDEGDLIVHRIAIIRGDTMIDLLTDHDALTVLRRERSLEALEIDGVLTATMPVKGLEVGDILRVTYSVTTSDPALKGNMQSSATLLPDQTEVGFARVRAIWPAAQHVEWKALAKVSDAKVTRAGDLRELTVATPLPKPPELPGDAPARFHPLPLVELSTFRDWPDVSQTMAPLFAPVAFAPGSPLAVEAARIAAAASDPLTRTALALASVQGNVRYLFNGLDHGNYVPQTPDKTWAIRSGDCKAKTLLLLSLLKALDIEAEPVLAHTKLGDFLPLRLPSAAAFNHILVAATIGGKRYWLDGTGLGTRIEDLGDTPNLRHVLPLRAAGATLEAIVTHANARPNFALDIDTDESAGIGIAAPTTVAVTFTGPTVEALKAADVQLSGDKRKAMIDTLSGGEALHMLIAERHIDFDRAKGTATVRVSGLTSGTWLREDQRYEDRFNGVLDSISFNGDRGRPEWRAIPVATAGIQSRFIRARIRLPGGGKGFSVEGDRTLPPTLAGDQVARTLVQTGDRFELTDRLDQTATEIPPDAIAETREKLALAKSRVLKVVAPRDYPAHWEVVRDARRDGRFEAIEAAYAAAIADATEKTPKQFARAEFRLNIYDRPGALTDLDAVVAARPTAPLLLVRARLLRDMRRDDRALADAKAAYALDPGSTDTLTAQAFLLAETGQQAAALTMLDTAIAAGGERKSTLLAAKATLLARDHQAAPALAASDAAIAAKPGDAKLLNARCWIKGTLGVELETALKDCTKALELGVDSAMTLDSRGMVYLKLGRLDDALTDLNAALLERPDAAGTLFLRGVIAQRQGTKGAADDLTGARTMAPRIDEEYGRYGVKAA